MNDTTAPMRRAPPVPAAVATATTQGAAGWWQAVRHPPPRLNLALQGGGAHGAFTWGVLDALLQDTGLEFEGLSGSSAGAMNAVVLADGWRKGGREGAQRALATFWTAVGKQLPAGLVTQGSNDAIDLSAAGKMLASWAGWFSPAQLNPFDLNPLRDLLERQVDFKALRQSSPFKLFVGATQARSGRLRVFREHELSVEVLLASACLPRIHHAVEIEGEAYWDGGFSANPAVFPLFYDCDARDVLLVLLAPLKREDTPRTLEDIEARIAELAFSTHFMREMRMFAQATAFSRPGLLARLSSGRLDQRLRQMRFHLVDTSEVGSLQRSETKMLAYGPFLDRLHVQGRDCGAAWVAAHASDVGRRSTLDVAACFG
ncbi:MAG: patatin-like phospholipase family protein [Rubrivivax sp.]|nr:patatin-like phospholipase family protein [Rubrivivax sp.]